MKLNAILLMVITSFLLGCGATSSFKRGMAQPADTPSENLAQQSPNYGLQADVANKIIAAAMPWDNQPFRVGLAEQCMNWTREVLMAACGAKFKTLETDQPWDGHLLGEGDKLLPEHADSLASETLGIKVTEIKHLAPGDLVFLKNTYGNWAEGVITHVGIATGDGNYIHRMTSNKGMVKIQAIDADEFDAGLRLSPELCQ